MFTVPTATTVPTGASTGSLQVKAVSPDLAAGFWLIKTVALPLMMVARFDGGFTKLQHCVMCGGEYVAVLFTVAAGMLCIFTSELRPPSMIPLNGCGTGTGGLVPGG